MKKLILILTFCLIPMMAEARSDSDYYADVCEQNYHRNYELDSWCESYQKHKDHGQSTKNDKGHISQIVQDHDNRPRDYAPPPPPPRPYGNYYGRPGYYSH